MTKNVCLGLEAKALRNYACGMSGRDECLNFSLSWAIWMEGWNLFVSGYIIANDIEGTKAAEGGSGLATAN